jgi:ABC-type Zn uptake system ZnuABC Zn-binding protein ZnuA
MAEHITAGLATADPANAAIYQANGAKYTAALQELDSFIQQQVAQLPAERRKLVTSHDTFGYFAARYGFQIVGTALASASTEASDPSPATIANLIKGIKAAGVPAIFAENVSNPKLMQTIADEAGVKLAPTLYTDALGESGSAGATYIEMMRSNATTIVTALKG